MSAVVFGQDMSKEQFNSLSSENRDLYTRLYYENIQREEKVNLYLRTHNVKRSFTDEGGEFFFMHDIINDNPIYITTDNAFAALATKTNQLQVGGEMGLHLDGSDVVVGVWDEGPAQSTHPEFSVSPGVFRVSILDFENLSESGEFNNHGTHVTGTIAAKGADPAAKGMATNVAIRSYNFQNDSNEMITAVTDLISPIILSNHSYGFSLDTYVSANLQWVMGAYTQDSRTIDEILFNNPKYLSVHSAGNSGTTSYDGQIAPGYDKLTGDKVGKNNLVIANANPTLIGGNLNLTINLSSSQGPTDDFRVKPDIAADGTNLYSSTPNNSYSIISGTSMSAANTTGTLVLLQQYYSQLHNGTYMNAATLKAIVCHTAVDDPATTGPDPKFGWGFLDAKASAEVIGGANTGTVVLEELTLENNESYSSTLMAEAGGKLRATICWTDLPGVISSGTLNDPTPALVNDLDLRITKDGIAFLPWKISSSPIGGITNSKGDNTVDNVERIDINVPESGEYTLTVSHKGTLQGSGNIQNFSLVVTGNNLTLGLEDNNLDRSLSVFPNPSNGEFTISFDTTTNNDVKLDIYDISGRAVYKNLYMNTSSRFKQTIDLKGLQSGVYVVNIFEGGRATTHKIIIE